MFYNFNRHKQLAAQMSGGPVRRAPASPRFQGNRKWGLWKRITVRVARLPLKWQHAVSIALLSAGIGYSFSLILPDYQIAALSKVFKNGSRNQKTIRAATSSPRQQAFEAYVDSLEQTHFRDSIYQSQQTAKDYAEQTIHP
ncbi:hypothetical protein [Dyadobacter soli]|uniref:hypothetical protein n=1 Tax=Dyadobacter soli TaxID=659014 RepID=UPI0015A32D3A|nr:hypothetical protein [Dyadobacter soli]